MLPDSHGHGLHFTPKKGWYALKGQKYIAQGNTLGIHNQIELAKLEM